MSKKHRGNGANGLTDSAPAQGLAAAPTKEQVEELEFAELQVTELTGSPPVPAEPKPELSLDQALRRVAGIVNEVEKARSDAKAAAEEAAKKTKAFDAQKREQEDLHRQRKKELEDEAKKNANERRGLDERELTLLELQSSLAEREANAEAGFLSQRKTILASLEEQIAAIRAERSQIALEIGEKRSSDEKERAAREDERAAAIRREDAARISAAAQARQDLQDELAKERVARLAALTMELERVREDTVAQAKSAREQHEAALEAERVGLSNELVGCAAERLANRRKVHDLEVDRELFQEDQRAFEAKVQRVATARLSKLEGDVAELTERLNLAVATRDGYQRSLAAHEEVQRRLGARKPEDLIEQLATLEKKNAELKTEMTKRLGPAAELRLAVLEKAESDWKEEQVVLRHKLADAEQRIGLLRVSATELETVRREREALETNKKLLGAALQELRAEVDKYTKADDKRNPMESLVAIDRDERLEIEARTWNPIGGSIKTLKDFADDLRHRIANGVQGRTLFYSERDVRCFLGGIAMSRLLLLQGISGTGKTSLPLAFAGAVGSSAIGSRATEAERRTSEAVEVVEVQAGWRDRQDLIGYFNAFHRHYYATNFLQALYRAGTPAFRDRPFLIILDEINLSRPEQFFADFLSALEQPESKQRLTLLNDPITDAPRLMVEGRHLPIPPNVWFIGTANHDETTTEFADKTYDRAHVMELPRRDPNHLFEIKKATAREAISYAGLRALFAQAAANQKEKVDQVHKWLRASPGIAGVLESKFRVGWGNRLEEQARQFVPVVVEAGGSVGEAMDHLLQTRVLRKLRDRHDVRHRALEEFRKTLDDSWNSLDKVNRPVRCLELLDRELRSKKDEEV